MEILWVHIRWDEGKPETAKFCCPACGSFVDERHKFSMVAAGRWRATKPEVKSHAGFKLNALVSLIANASWPQLAAQWLAAQDDPGALQVFVNTVLAEPWREAGELVDESALASRAENFGLDNLPPEVLAITGGCDVQDDRLEISVCGWGADSSCLVLGHFVLFGSPDDNSLWAEVDALLKARWRHPYGRLLGIEALAVDSGDGDWTQKVYDYAFPRARHRIMAIKGMGGSRPIIKASEGKMKGGGRLWICGVDVIKTQIFSRLQRGRMIRFSNTLEAVYYEQLCSERRIVRYVRGKPIRRFERITGRVRAEALDCLTYAFGARHALPLNIIHREQALRGEHQPQAVQIDPGEPTGWVGAGPNWIRDGGRR